MNQEKKRLIKTRMEALFKYLARAQQQLNVVDQRKTKMKELFKHLGRAKHQVDKLVKFLLNEMKIYLLGIGEEKLFICLKDGQHRLDEFLQLCQDKMKNENSKSASKPNDQNLASPFIISVDTSESEQEYSNNGKYKKVHARDRNGPSRNVYDKRTFNLNEAMNEGGIPKRRKIRNKKQSQSKESEKDEMKNENSKSASKPNDQNLASPFIISVDTSESEQEYSNNGKYKKVHEKDRNGPSLYDKRTLDQNKAMNEGGIPKRRKIRNKKQSQSNESEKSYDNEGKRGNRCDPSKKKLCSSCKSKSHRTRNCSNINKRCSDDCSIRKRRLAKKNQNRQ